MKITFAALLLCTLLILSSCGGGQADKQPSNIGENPAMPLESMTVLYGFLSRSGEMVIQPQYLMKQKTALSFVPHFSDGIAVICDQEQYGFINARGEVLLPFVYEDACPFQNGVAWVKEGGKWGCIDADGTYITKPTYASIRYADTEFVGVELDGLWGYANRRGEIVVPVQYADIAQFYRGYALVCIKDKKTNDWLWGAIDAQGNSVSAPAMPFITAGYRIEFHDGLAHVWDKAEEGARSWYIDETCNAVFQDAVSYASAFSEGLAVVRTQPGAYAGYIDIHGSWAIEPAFDAAASFSDGLALVKLPGRESYSFINRAGEVVIESVTRDSSGFSEGLARIYVDGYYGYIDQTGTVVIAPQFDFASDFQGGLAYVTSKTGNGFINQTGEMEIVLDEGFYPIGYNTDDYHFYEGVMAVAQIIDP